MNKKRVLIISIVVLILTALGLGIYFYLTREDEKSSLTVLDKQWIEDNKNQVIDLSIVSNVPVFSMNGEGVLFEFINDIEKTTGLEFNKLSYTKDESASSDYSFSLVDSVGKKDIVVYEDNYAIVGKNNVKYNNLESIPKMTIGVLSSDLENVDYYLKDNKNIVYKSYSKMRELLLSIEDDVDAIVIPKTLYLKEIIENDKLNINYNITEMKKYLVLKLGNTKKLNSIMSKYYKKWSKDNFDDRFNKYFSENYFDFSEIYEQDKAKLTGKRYKYGFVESIPYDKVVNESLAGVNKEIIKAFSTLSNVEVSFKEYKNYSTLINDFNKGEVDLFLNTSINDKFEADNIKSVSVYDTKAVVLVKNSSDSVINSISSLKNYNVKTIKGSLVNKSVEENGIKTKTYSGIDSLIKSLQSDDIVVIDYNSYLMYRNGDLKKYYPAYIYNLSNQYAFVLRDVKANNIFNDYFNFYLSFINEKEYINKIDSNDFHVVVSHKFIRCSLIAVIILAIITIVLNVIKKAKKKNNRNENISREDKIKYIDMLTSLKNRNYLNDYMDRWDSSEIYPQSIVIVDLNNVAYINDNYGHEEGDNVIKSAANILINTQMENTEIIRTNGNEFLIYLVEYDEKQVLTYIRKLNKEFKDLEHGFGAAIGYSMINDGIKTIDDAINEATLDMRNNKEEN